MKIFLFDLDGVLVQPLGYRAAVRATVNDFARAMGLPEIAPSDETVAIFEAQGITCEWDMIPILLSIILEAAFSAQSEQAPNGALDSLQAATSYLHSRRVGEISVDYAPILRSLAGVSRAGEAPADTLLALCEAGEGEHLFPTLARSGLLRELLSNTRRPARSRSTAVFQTYVLGDETYCSVMRLPALIKSGSLLAEHDRPLLAPPTRDRLLAEREAGRLQMAAYTARPSVPVREPEEPLAIFTPEGEMALALVGMESIPLIGSGQMGEAAWKLGEKEDTLTKPSPYHALVAIFAALTGDRSAALAQMEAIFNHRERGASRPSPDHLPEQLTVHIFEDSPSGTSGVIGAASILTELGVQVELRQWGVSKHPEKIEALEKVGSKVYPDVNAAVAAALDENR